MLLFFVSVEEEFWPHAWNIEPGEYGFSGFKFCATGLLCTALILNKKTVLYDLNVYLWQ